MSRWQKTESGWRSTEEPLLEQKKKPVSAAASTTTMSRWQGTENGWRENEEIVPEQKHGSRESPTEPSVVLIGTLNCLGDAYNPFEFMCDEAGFQAAYARLQEVATGLTWQQFADGCGEEVLTSWGVGTNAAQALARLQAHCDSGKQLWQFFDEATLAQDNKLVAPRLNLLTFAMRPHGGDSDARPAWELCEHWRKEMLTLATTAVAEAPYTADANLWLWDLACNVVAASAQAEYGHVCASSHLNPPTRGVRIWC